MKSYLFKKYYPFIIIILLVISNVFTYCYFSNNKETNVVEEKPINEVALIEDTNLITVDIKGEIKKPGIYELALGSNVADLIKLAGGIKKTGTTSNLNLARKLTDQSVIVIKNKNQKNTKTVEEPCVCKDVEISDCNNESSIIEVVKSDKLEGEAKPTITEVKTSNKVSINNASKESLMTLSGIGEAKAVAIINYRNEYGNFTKLEDLTKVSGISETIFNKIKDNIEL